MIVLQTPSWDNPFHVVVPGRQDSSGSNVKGGLQCENTVEAVWWKDHHTGFFETEQQEVIHLIYEQTRCIHRSVRMYWSPPTQIILVSMAQNPNLIKVPSVQFFFWKWDWKCTLCPNIWAIIWPANQWLWWISMYAGCMTNTDFQPVASGINLSSFSRKHLGTSRSVFILPIPTPAFVAAGLDGIGGLKCTRMLLYVSHVLFERYWSRAFVMCGPDMGLWCVVLVDGLKRSSSEPSILAGMAVM